MSLKFPLENEKQLCRNISQSRHAP